MPDTSAGLVIQRRLPVVREMMEGNGSVTVTMSVSMTLEGSAARAKSGDSVTVG